MVGPHHAPASKPPVHSTIVIDLAIDSSTPRLVVGLVRDRSEVIAKRLIDDARRHNESLVPAVLQCLDEAGLEFDNLDRVTCGCGPGPFTGLRVGMATAAALADARGIELRGVCSLDATAQDPQLRAASALVISDARRREVYFAAYRSDGSRALGPDVARPAELPRADIDPLEVEVVSAPESVELPEWLAPTRRVAIPPSPEGLCAAPEVTFEPIYLRRPDAVVPKVEVSGALRR